MSRLKAICVDCADPWALAHWWADVLGYRVRPHTPEDLAALRAQGIDRPEDDPAIATDPVDGIGPPVWFNKVPEPKTGKVRIHLDVHGEVEDVARRGAKVQQHLEHWTMMTDPEGNEFCVFPPDPH